LLTDSETRTERQLLQTPAGIKDFQSPLHYCKWDWTLQCMFWQRVRGGYTPQPLAHQHDEYCEWFTHPNAEGKITRVDITCESPEYWDFLFQNEPHTCLKLYQ